MGMMKNYLLDVVDNSCSTGVAKNEDAVLDAIMAGKIKLTYNMADDVAAINAYYTK